MACAPQCIADLQHLADATHREVRACSCSCPTCSAAAAALLPSWMRRHAIQAHAVACVFMSQKLDSVYHRLESVVHSSIVELRKMQQRQMEPEYFNPDGVGPFG
jgi:hypothetical protein